MQLFGEICGKGVVLCCVVSFSRHLAPCAQPCMMCGLLHVRVDDEGDDGAVCALCCLKKKQDSLSECTLSDYSSCFNTHACRDEMFVAQAAE